MLPGGTYAMKRARASRLSNRSRSSGTSTMRWPIGSLSADFAAARCQPATEVLGTLAVSTTEMFRRGTTFEKYAAAASTSASVTSLDSAIMNFGGSLSGTEVARAPLLKSAICWAMYAAGRPWRLLFSGPPGPSAR